jgi:hypothetical protein
MHIRAKLREFPMSKQKPGSYRTTISIPQDLKRRMDKAGRGVNWSAIAAMAFEAKLAEIAGKKEKKSMQDVIQRLRGLSAAAKQETYMEGYEAGHAWAMDDADVAQLQQLETAWSNRGRQAFDILKGTDDCIDPSEVLARMIDPEADPVWITSFWRQFGPRRVTSRAAFCMGFLRGALAVWDKVKDEL